MTVLSLFLKTKLPHQNLKHLNFAIMTVLWTMLKNLRVITLSQHRNIGNVKERVRIGKIYLNTNLKLKRQYAFRLKLSLRSIFIIQAFWNTAVRRKKRLEVRL